MSIRRALGALSVVVLAAASFSSVAFAAWQASSSTANAAAKAATMPAGRVPTPSVSGSSVQLVWPAVTVAGSPVDGYVVQAYDATTNASRAVNASCAGTVITTSCTETNAPAGSWRYTVTPTSSGWHGAESPESSTATVAPAAPTIAITFPSLSAYNGAGWNAGCSSSICGTASAGAGVKIVQVSVKQASNNRYWNGTSFGASSETFITATGTTSWSLSFPASRFGEGSYTVRAVVTDNLNATASGTATFTSDNIAPTAAVLGTSAMRNGDELSLFNVTEQGSGIASVQYRYCSGPASCTPTTVIGSVPQPFTAAYSLPWTSMPADGTYQVAALLTDNAGNSRLTPNQAIVLDNTPPTVTGLSVSNGGTQGRADTNDRVQITFSEGLLGSSLCSNWLGTGSQSITGNNQVTVTINDNNGPHGDDTLTVTSTVCAFHLGTIDLGSGAWVTSTTTFSGTGSKASTITYASGTLTIELGNGNGASNVPAQTMSYTPDGVISDAAGNTIVPAPFQQANLRF